MSKILCLKDLCFNKDYAIVLHKNHVSEALETIGLRSFEEVLKRYHEEVTTVLLTGDLFEEDILLIDQVDAFIDIMNAYKNLSFVIAPDKAISEESWYHIIHWPEQCHLVSEQVNYYEDVDEQLILYSGDINDSLQESDYKKVSVFGQWHQDQPRFLPADFSPAQEKSILIYDTDTETSEWHGHSSLILKSFEVEIEPDTTMEAIGEKILAEKISDQEMVFYKCILTGFVSHDMDKDLVNQVREVVSNQMDCLYLNKTYKNYQVDSIQQENKDNLIGIFIENVQKSGLGEEEEKRIIETGLDYLL